jgi:hypothetical protein
LWLIGSLKLTPPALFAASISLTAVLAKLNCGLNVGLMREAQ